MTYFYRYITVDLIKLIEVYRNQDTMTRGVAQG